MAEYGEPRIFPSLIDFPAEILQNIFDFLSSDHLQFSVSKVCRRFADLLADEVYFKTRIRRKYLDDGAYNPFLKAYGLLDERPKTDRGDSITWTEIAIRNDFREKLCQDEGAFEHVALGAPHSMTVDTVKLFDDGRLCVTGGRDRLMCVWDVGDLSKPLVVEQQAHQGWIWDITGHEDGSFFSCGWERNIKEWRAGSGLECVRSFQTERPAMRLASVPGRLFAGLHTGKVVLIDPRGKDEKAPLTYMAHRGTITGLKVWGNSVLTVGEDRRMAAFDLRTMKRYFQRNVNGSCPRSTAVYGGLWYFGDTQGNLVVHNIEHINKPIFYTNIWEPNAINSIHASMEGIITGSSDGKLRFLSVIRPFRLQKEMDFKGEIVSIDYKKNIIVTGTTDSTASFHVIKHKENF